VIDLLIEFLRHIDSLNSWAIKCLKLGLNYGFEALREEYWPIYATTYKLWLGPFVIVWRVITLRMASLSHMVAANESE
jgi:hypothetical protein